MTLVVLAVVVAAVLGFAFRGSFKRFGRPPLQRNGVLAFAALAQITALLARHPGVYAGWLGCGAIALVVYARLNHGRPGLLLAANGLLLNVLVILVNWGMPMSLAAAERAGAPVDQSALTADPLHRAVDGDTLLPWLTESIPLALPLRPGVASPGDLLAAAGAAVFIFTGLTGRGRLVPAPRAAVPGKRKRKKKRTAASADSAATGLETTSTAMASAGAVGVSSGAVSVEDDEIGAAAVAIFSPQRTGEPGGGPAGSAPMSTGSTAFAPVESSSRYDVVEAQFVHPAAMADTDVAEPQVAKPEQSAATQPELAQPRVELPVAEAQDVAQQRLEPPAAIAVGAAAAPAEESDAERMARRRERKRGRKIARRERTTALTPTGATAAAEPPTGTTADAEPPPAETPTAETPTASPAAPLAPIAATPSPDASQRNGGPDHESAGSGLADEAGAPAARDIPEDADPAPSGTAEPEEPVESADAGDESQVAVPATPPAAWRI